MSKFLISCCSALFWPNVDEHRPVPLDDQSSGNGGDAQASLFPSSYGDPSAAQQKEGSLAEKRGQDPQDQCDRSKVIEKYL
jgi:hypothetical protein